MKLQSTLFEAGKKENEFLVVKITNCKPHLVLIVYYGTQSGSFGVDQVKLHISELLEVTKKYINQGCHVKLCGDANLHIGNSEIPLNHPDPTPNGRIFLTLIKELGMKVMNNLSPDPITFVDRSGKDHKRIVLDLAISNCPDTISNFKTDNDDHDFELTPYSVHIKKKQTSRTYADHFGVMFDYETLWQDRVKFKRDSIWNYKRQLGDLKFDLFTSNACNFLLNKVLSEKDINAVHKSQFRDKKETNQIYKIKKVILKGQNDRQDVGVEVEGSDQVLEDLGEVMDYVLEYNVKNMQKVDPSLQVKEIMERKAAVINMMLSDESVDQFPKSIPWHIFLKVLKKIMRQKKACFRDIIKSGRNFKYALYCLLNRMYENEEFPEECSHTWLTKIWKKKGSKSRLKDNRFVHGKEPISKFLEKCVIAIIEEKLDIRPRSPRPAAGRGDPRTTSSSRS